jgi:uncharacterized protein
LRTLRAMALGGMRDHVGGGFHRYSVDAAWRVPHFEKMLYDQAQLVIAYVEGALVSGDRFYLEVAEDTLSYVLREMTDAAGGFHSAEDADSVRPEAPVGDSHKAEGAFYLWREQEIDQLLGADAAVFKLRFGVEPDGNAPIDPQQEFTGKNLLYVARSIDDVAARLQLDSAKVVEALNRARTTLYGARLARPRPHRDDKVLTAWNGLMIAALARTARAVRASSQPKAAGGYIEAASRAARFIRRTLWDSSSGTLRRRYRDGNAGIDGYAEDYAYLAFGLLELLQATGEVEWLEWAVELQKQMDERFWDEQSGAWFSTTGADPSVLLRMKEDYDGAEPTASSVAAWNLLILSHLQNESVWPHRIERTLEFFGERLEKIGRAVPMMAAALSMRYAGIAQIVIAGSLNGGRAELEREVDGRYLPFSVVLSVDRLRQQQLGEHLPWIAAMRPESGAAAYVCRDFTCRQPVGDPAALRDLLREL